MFNQGFKLFKKVPCSNYVWSACDTMVEHGWNKNSSFEIKKKTLSCNIVNELHPMNQHAIATMSFSKLITVEYTILQKSSV